MGGLCQVLTHQWIRQGGFSPVWPPHEPNKARSKAFGALAQLEAAELRLDGQIVQVGERRQRVVWLHNLT